MLETKPPVAPDQAIWHDKIAQATVAAAIVLNLILFAFLLVIIGRLPDQVTLHFNTAGVADRTGSPFGLMVLPIIGLISWILAIFIGWYHYRVRQEPPIAYIVWGSTILIQVATWIGLIWLVV